MDNIVCYNCGKTEEVIEVHTSLKFRNNTLYKYIHRVNRNFRKICGLGDDVYLCKECINHKCILCGVLLSNTRTCRCNQKHGEYYEDHPDFCKECYDKNTKVIKIYEDKISLE